MPDLATADEQGMTGFDAILWYGLFLPKGTPADYRAEAQRRHHCHHEYAGRAGAHEADRRGPSPPEFRTSEYLGKLVESEIEKWLAPIKASGVTAD